MNLAMDFIHPVEDVAKGLVQGVVNPAAKLGNEVLDLGDMTDALVAAATGNKQASINAQEAGNRDVAPGGGAFHQGGVVQGNNFNGPGGSLSGKQIESTIGTGAELGTYATGAGAAEEAVGTVATKATPDLAMDFIHGAGAGAAYNATYTAGSEAANNQPISPGQITKGAVEGAAVGGVIGAAVPQVAEAVRNRTPLNQVGGVRLPSDQFSNEDLQDMANSTDIPKVEKQLEPVTGPIVAHEIAPAVAKSTDPNVAANIIDTSINNKIPPALSAETTTSLLGNTPPQNSLTPVGGGAILQEGRGLSSTASGATNQLLIDGRQLNTAQTDALNSTLKANGGSGLEKNGTPTPVSIDELKMAATAHPAILQNSEIQRALSAAQQTTSNLPTSSPSGLEAGTNGQLPSAANTTTPSTTSSGTSGVSPTSDINTPTQVAGESSAEINNFMNAPGETGPSTAGQNGIENQLTDMANTGAYNTDELMDHYFRNVPNAKLSDAQATLDKVLSSSAVDKSKINAGENPLTGQVKLAPVGEGDDMAAQLNGRNAGQNIGKVGAPAYQALEKLDAHDRDLTRYLRGKDPQEVQQLIDQAHDPNTFAQFVDANKQYNDYAQAAGAGLGQQLPYRVNYGTRVPYDPPEGIPEGSGTPGAANPENPSYTQQRYFNTHEEALANGYTPKNEDPLEDLRNDINQRGYNQTQLALAKGYEDAHPGQVRLLNDNSPVPTGYHQLLIPGGEHIALPTEIADKINARVVTNTPGKILGAYDTINQAGKALELGGGTFHGFNTAGTFVGQQLASGKALTDMPALGRVVANFFSDAHNEQYFDDASDASKAPSGGLDDNHSLVDGANAAGLNIKNTSVDISNPSKDTLAGKVIGIPGLKQIHEAVFNRQIPTMMLETFRQKTQGLDIFGSADDRLEAEKIARGINKEFGVTDHDLAGMTSQQFKIAARVMLAPGYQEGVVHTLLTALDPRNIGTAEGHLAREAVLGKALLFGGLSALGGAVGGDYKGMDAKQTALAIMNKAINPSFNIGGYKVETPATNISDIAKPIEESIAGEKSGKGGLIGAEDFASSHLAFLPSKIEEGVGNKNYEGNPIYGTDYFGRPISGATTAENLASGILPIPLAQGEAQATGQQNTAASVANTLGFNVAPTGDTEYAPIYMQTYLQQLQATPGVPKAQIDADTQFAEALSQGDYGRSKTLTKAETYLAQAEKSNSVKTAAQLQQKATDVIDAYNKKLVAALEPWAQSGGTKYLDGTMLEILRQTMVTYKSANENVNYDIKTNPTAYGVPIAALAGEGANSGQVSQNTNQG